MRLKHVTKFWFFSFLALGFLALLATHCNKEDEYVINTVTDIDGNVYHTVAIGTQVWMVENLKTTRYNDGADIPLVTDDTAWSTLTTPGYCWLENDSLNNKPAYGALYNWYAVNTGKLCPAGWHVPTDSDWSTLTTYLGGESVAGGKLKETGSAHWLFPYPGTDNSSGFAARPGGSRIGDGTFTTAGIAGNWWTSTDYDNSYAWYRNMGGYSNSVSRSSFFKENGFSVRCMKD